MKILMFSWKDTKNPAAGGAEVMTWEILKGLVKAGHQVTLFTSRYGIETPEREIVEGVQIYRAGGRFGVYFWAVLYYFRFFRGKFDLVIDQANTLPFFTPLFVRERKIAFFPQLARELWFYETRFPISLIGYLLEPVILLFYRNTQIVTISTSSKKDLQRFGLKKIRLVPVVSDIQFTDQIPDPSPGFNIGFVGRLVPGKRALHAVEAFPLIREEIANAKLFIIGRGTQQYQNLIQKRVRELFLETSVTLVRNATDEERNKILNRLHVLLVTSVKEGWGLVVTEANSRGIPAIVYNVDGLRDSVLDGQTGLICRINEPKELAALVLRLYRDRDLYQKMRLGAWEFSKSFTRARAVDEFLSAIEAR